MPARAELDPAFSRTLHVEDVPPEGLDLMISATDAERSAIAIQDGLENLTKLEASLRVAPWRGNGLAVTGELHARITQICVVTLEPFDSELVEPIDVRFAPITAAETPESSPGRTKEAPARRRRAATRPPPSQVIEFDGDDPPDPLIDDRVDLGALVAEFLALGLDPYPRKPGVEFDATPGSESAESPFAKLQALKGKTPQGG
jgi:Large ribosomal RNA subunit accumulation protein YceD